MRWLLLIYHLLYHPQVHRCHMWLAAATLHQQALQSKRRHHHFLGLPRQRTMRRPFARRIPPRITARQVFTNVLCPVSRQMPIWYIESHLAFDTTKYGDSLLSSDIIQMRLSSKFVLQGANLIFGRIAEDGSLENACTIDTHESRSGGASVNCCCAAAYVDRHRDDAKL